MLALSPWAHGDSLWVRTGTHGQPQAQPYFFDPDLSALYRGLPPCRGDPAHAALGAAACPGTDAAA